MKSSFVALIAAAGLVGGIASAQAADLGGDCCADLEERVAELEATAARKGNRKVKLTVSGQVHESILFWDDGAEENIYIGTNDIARTRFRFVGDAKINAEWSAGYLLEIGVRAGRLGRTNANIDDAAAPDFGLDVRHSAWWISNKQYGKVWVGQTASAAESITEINLANVGHFLTQNIGDSNLANFTVRGTGRTLRELVGPGNHQPGEGDRFNVVKYETPTIAGFQLSAAAGEDDLWDVALRYAGEFSGFKIAGGIGYAVMTTNNAPNLTGAANNTAEWSCGVFTGTARTISNECQQFGTSGAIMHVETGLYVHAAYGTWNSDVSGAFGDDARSFYIQAGIEKNWFGIGKTTIFGEYQDTENNFGRVNVGAAAIASFKSEQTMWGLGFNQSIDAAAMDLYVHYRNHDAECVVGADCGGAGAGQKIQGVSMGGIIRF